MTTTAVPRPGHVDIMYAVMTAEALDRDDRLPEGLEPLLRRNGASEELMAMWRERPHAQVLVQVAPLAGAGDAHVQMRAAAFALAAEHDGLVIDLALPRLLEPPRGEIRLEYADAWVLVHYDVASRGVLGTRGLESFGLPELCVKVPEGAEAAMVGAVTSGLTHRLLTEWPHVDPVGPAVITLRDIAFGLGDPQADSIGTERRVRVEISYDDVAHELDVTLADDPAILFR
ncbi:hypothetical protein D9V41_03835 [Aeromicrobium phragmitis]|uniref:Uncharacterized protein n=1 Tax=Aeromicrobium phragmitis TaxID=2478914 RepID=A0A3L8PNM2_9ACTN|nr:hypothetical protein [Aeromicrobium phragmitis]RLV56910.1 hypothetical protein D9V41_03835 [Aeromicrobium phragmitis]